MKKFAGKMFRKVPLIVILGSTGTGKTKLSLELAEKYGGEIISADSMQVYANLNIATAKANREEQTRVKHHLLDVATPAEPFTVLNFRNAALPILETLLAQSKCPIVVGGTNYYIESLLWHTLVSPDMENNPTASNTTSTTTDVNYAENRKLSATTTTTSQATSSCDATAATSGTTIVSETATENPIFLTAAALSTMSSELLHQHLKIIDPTSAARMHPNNKRKIVRAIEVFQQSGQTLTTKLQQQRQQPGANRLGGPRRYPHTILFWLRCNQDVLNERLDKRVDSMLEQGLLREIRAFHTQHMSDKSSCEIPYTQGVLQTIGFKEFIPYLEKYNAVNDQKIEEYLKQNAYQLPTIKDRTTTKKTIKKETLPESSLNDPNNEKTTTNDVVPPGLELLSVCLNELKLVTKRYSKNQIKWINNRFLASKDRQVPALYELDTSDVTIWNEVVFGRATTVIDCYREDRVCEVEPMPKREHPGAGLDEETSHHCAICERFFIGEYQWSLHLKSNKHKRRKEGRRRKAKLEGDKIIDSNAEKETGTEKTVD